ncbi:large ribosomal subunit protein mL65 [Drosophila tropicalis]|uniref:large ribosomal subunit protein mL65 n=1 Tax=Drosophila tropicalis TaxID=46794 RepID=UPI0035AB7299
MKMWKLGHGKQLQHRLQSAIVNGARRLQSQTKAITDADAEPEYPAIKDLSFKARKEQIAVDWHEELRQVPTIEEKLIKVNMPRYYGYKVVQLTDKQIPYNALGLTQHYTRTKLEEVPVKGKEEATTTDQKQLESFVQTARGDLIDALEFSHDYYSNQPGSQAVDPITKEQELTQIIVEQVNRAILQVLQGDCPHLLDVEVDYNPRHEAFWAVGGVEPPKNVVSSKKGRDWQKDDANDKVVDRLVQYTGSPYLSLRHHQQLQPWKSPEESNNIEEAKKLPRYTHDARTLGYNCTHQHAVNVPGYWPNVGGSITSFSNFGLISFQSRAHLATKSFARDSKELQDALHALGIQSSYAWLLAQANYNGFNTYNDITYPMNTQTIITNGREWSFYEYQLNTLLQHSRHVDENPRLNFCRGTAPLPLYGEISASGKVVDFNEAALNQLIAFYVNSPVISRSTEDLQPYVQSQLLDYDNVEQREFIQKTVQHLSSKRPRHLELPEIYLWEKIYKIDHKTRPMEARRRYFERDINPWRRTLDQHDLTYVPRAVRPGGRKNREGRFKKTYYP